MYSNKEWFIFYGWFIVQIPLIMWHTMCPQELPWYVTFIPSFFVGLRFIYYIFKIWLTSNIRIEKEKMK